LQVWQNVLQLWEYQLEERVKNGHVSRMLAPLSRRIVDRSATAAVFVKFGFDKNGYLPYEVFIQAITASPARLLGHEVILNKTIGGKNGVEDLVDIALLVGDAKIDYPKCKMGVFPPSGFDERLAIRSMKLPRAHMYLEHVYGYAGVRFLLLMGPCRLAHHAVLKHARSPAAYKAGQLDALLDQSRSSFDRCPEKCQERGRLPAPFVSVHSCVCSTASGKLASFTATPSQSQCCSQHCVFTVCAVA
jgi:hypothetical protein